MQNFLSSNRLRDEIQLVYILTRESAIDFRFKRMIATNTNDYSSFRTITQGIRISCEINSIIQLLYISQIVGELHMDRRIFLLLFLEMFGGRFQQFTPFLNIYSIHLII